MTPAQLKESLLQYAIQGKLVEQRPEEGTAEELLSVIAKEKNLLIAEGRIPKEKKLPLISDEEKEFDIPDNWKYVRVQDIASYITDYVANGSFATLKKHTTTYKTPNYAIFVRTMDLTANFVGECSYIDKESYDFLEKSKLYGGELILPNIGGSIGKAFLMPDLGMPMSLAPNSIMLKFLHPVMNKFFAYIIQSSYGKKFLIDTKGGTATPKFSKTELRNMVVMLPPIKEIERIVAKIEELLPYVDRYAEAYEKLELFNAKFPEDMKKSILQYAIQGKLVEQRPEEGTAEELLLEVERKYKSSVEEGKLKKIKPFEPIIEDEYPFDIPETWKWVYVNDIAFVTKLAGFEYTKYMAGAITNDGEVPIVRAKNVKPNNFMENEEEFISLELSEQLQRCALDKPCVLMTFIGAGIGEVAVFENKRRNHLAPNVAKIVPHIDMNKYMLYYFMSPTGQNEIFKFMKAVAQPSLSMDTIRQVKIPVPPIAEQIRIVKKVEELLPFCERLVK